MSARKDAQSKSKGAFSKGGIMLKKTLIVLLSAVAILPFAGQISASPQDLNANDDSLAWYWGGRGFAGGYSGYGGWGDNGWGYGYPYSGYSGYGGWGDNGWGYGYPYSGYGCGWGGCY
jgi:hypothetical protein